MSALLTIAATFGVLLVVALPIAALSARGRKRLRGVMEQPALSAPAVGGRLSSALEPVDRASRAWLVAAGRVSDLIAAYAEALPLLEVMAAARSSPRVYPSNWVGETNDAFNDALGSLKLAQTGWKAAFDALPARLVDELREPAAPLMRLLGQATMQPQLTPASSFAYLDRESLDRLKSACAALSVPLGEFLRALVTSSNDPYR